MKLTDYLDALTRPIRQRQALDLSNPELFRPSMAFLYRTMIGSEDMLKFAIGEMANKEGKFNAHLKRYFEEHLVEESGHEAWLKADLEAAGIEVERRVDWLAAALVGSQFYAMRYGHPSSLLGFMYYVESNPVSIEVIEALEAVHGTEVMRTFRYHAVNDKDHAKDLISIINVAPEEYHDLICSSAVQSGHYWVQAANNVRGTPCSH